MANLVGLTQDATREPIIFLKVKMYLGWGHDLGSRHFTLSLLRYFLSWKISLPNFLFDVEGEWQKGSALHFLHPPPMDFYHRKSREEKDVDE